MQEGLHENAGLPCPQRDRQVSGCSGYKRVKALFSSFALHLLLYGNVLPYVVHFILRFPQFGIRLFEGGAYMGAGGRTACLQHACGASAPQSSGGKAAGTCAPLLRKAIP